MPASRTVVTNTLCLDNGGNSGVNYLAKPFVSRLKGPFDFVGQAGLSPLPALWTVVPKPTNPLHSLWIIKLGGLYAKGPICQDQDTDFLSSTQ